jgi:hypothetical protein
VSTRVKSGRNSASLGCMDDTDVAWRGSRVPVGGTLDYLSVTALNDAIWFSAAPLMVSSKSEN